MRSIVEFHEKAPVPYSLETVYLRNYHPGRQVMLSIQTQCANQENIGLQCTSMARAGENSSAASDQLLYLKTIKFMNQVCPLGWYYSCQTLQHPESSTCGKYCIYFLKQRFSGKSYQDFLSKFSKSTIQNDRIINHQIKNKKAHKGPKNIRGISYLSSYLFHARGFR